MFCIVAETAKMILCDGCTSSTLLFMDFFLRGLDLKELRLSLFKCIAFQEAKNNTTDKTHLQLVDNGCQRCNKHGEEITARALVSLICMTKSSLCNKFYVPQIAWTR